MSVHRVFVERHYIDVIWFDVEAKTPARAKQLASKAAYKLRPDSRAAATDNGWHVDDVTVEVTRPGQNDSGTHEMREVLPKIWMFAPDADGAL